MLMAGRLVGKVDSRLLVGIGVTLMGVSLWMMTGFAIARLLPFQTIAGLPAQVFLGQIGGAELGPTLMLQAFWVLVLTTIGLLMSGSMRKPYSPRSTG